MFNQKNVIVNPHYTYTRPLWVIKIVKMKIYLFIFFILVSGFAFSQRDILVSEQEKVIDSMEIEKIESLVDSIRLDKTLQKISIDSISLPGKFSAKEEFYKAEIFFRRDEIVKISLNPI